MNLNQIKAAALTAEVARNAIANPVMPLPEQYANWQRIHNPATISQQIQQPPWHPPTSGR